MRRGAIVLILAIGAAGCTSGSGAPDTMPSTLPTTPSTTPAGDTTMDTTTTTAPPPTRTMPSTSTTTPARTPPPTVPIADFCVDGRSRLVAGIATTIGEPPIQELLITDMGTAEIAAVPAAALSGAMTGAIALPDGSALVATEGAVPGLHLVTDSGSTQVVTYEAGSVTITGMQCGPRTFVLDAVVARDELDGRLLSFNGSYTDPTRLTELWSIDGLGATYTEHSPDGRYVAVTVWPVDPVFGPELSVLDATSGAAIDVPIPLGPTFGSGNALLDVPVGLDWLPDGRLLFFSTAPGGFASPDSVAIDLDAGYVEAWDLDEFTHPSICRFEGRSLESSGPYALFVDGDMAETVPFDADVIRFTC